MKANPTHRLPLPDYLYHQLCEIQLAEKMAGNCLTLTVILAEVLTGKRPPLREALN